MAQNGEPAPSSKRFRVLSKLGAGAMGHVYLAYDRQRRANVALKTLRSLEGSALLHFKREFRFLAGIVHTNLVTLYDLTSEGDAWFVAMELAFCLHARASTGLNRLTHR